MRTRIISSWTSWRRAWALAAVGALLVLQGCSTNGVLDTGSLGEPTEISSSLDATAKLEPETTIEEARRQFRDGNFGAASRLFKKQVEKSPQDSEAWIGLAASYDEIGRFDLADRAYARVRTLVGDTPEVMNNLGYSYLLRGQLNKSKSYLVTALSNDPENGHIQHNLKLLNARLAKAGQPTVLITPPRQL